MVRMRPPDVMQRARSILSAFDAGTTQLQPELQQRIANVRQKEAEIQSAIAEMKAQQQVFRNVGQVRKNALLREYRAVRAEFRERTGPMLRELDWIDKYQAMSTNGYRQRITGLRRQCRALHREIGLFDMTPVQRPRSS